MAISFGDNLSKSFAYANGAFKSFGGWFILLILSLLVYSGVAALFLGMLAVVAGLFIMSGAYASGDFSPEFMAAVGMADAAFIGLFFGGFIMIILGGIALNGFILRVYKGGELNFRSPFKMFWQGVVSLLIVLIYLIPYSIVSNLVLLGPVENAIYSIIVVGIIPILLLLISTILALNATIRYAKKGRFGAAFHLGKLCGIVGNVGWLRYLGHAVLFALILLVVEIIFMIIPFIGGMIFVIAYPFIMIVQAKFFANLYETGEALGETAEVQAAE